VKEELPLSCCYFLTAVPRARPLQQMRQQIVQTRRLERPVLMETKGSIEMAWEVFLAVAALNQTHRVVTNLH
jgi:hypothetical protein